MTKYRKKTLIEAEQFDGSDEMINKYNIQVDFQYTAFDEIGMEYLRTVPFRLVTLEGDMEFNIGDWIATGIKGEHWAIADDVFKQTYEEVEE